MPDLQIPAPGVKAAPLIYTVPGSVEMIVKAAFATFNGSGAGGAFLPCLRVLSPAGLVVGEYVTDASVAAGSSAEVSFAPFLRGASSGASAAATVMAVAYRQNFNIPSAAGGSAADFDPWDYLDTSGAEIDLDGSDRVRINETGLYLVMPALDVLDNTWLATDHMDLNFTLLTGGAQNSFVQTWPGQTIGIASSGVDFGQRAWNVFASIYLNIITAPETIRAQVLQVSGGAAHTATSTFASMSVQRIGDAPNMALD